MDVKKIYLDWLDRNIIQNRINNKIDELEFQFLPLEEGVVDRLSIYVTKEKKGFSVCSDFCGTEEEPWSYVCRDENDIARCIQGIINSVLRRSAK